MKKIKHGDIVKVKIGMCRLCKPIIEYYRDVIGFEKENMDDFMGLLNLIHKTHKRWSTKYFAFSFVPRL